MDVITNHSSYSQGTLTDHLDNMQAYNLHQGVDRLLDVSREIALSGAYYALIVPFPLSQEISIDSQQQRTGVIQVAAGSILVSITGIGIPDNNFFLRVYDKATGVDLFDRQWGYCSNSCPPLDISLTTDTMGDDGNGPFGPWYLTDPYIVLEPNSLEISIQNAAQTTQQIQVALAFAVPYGEAGTGADRVIIGN